LIEIFSHQQLKQTKAFFEEHFLMILSGVLQLPLIKSKVLGTKTAKVPVFGTLFAMLGGTYITTTRVILPAIATTKSTKM